MMEKPTRIFFNENAGYDFVAIRNEVVAGFVKRFQKVYSFVEQKWSGRKKINFAHDAKKEQKVFTNEIISGFVKKWTSIVLQFADN